MDKRKDLENLKARRSFLEDTNRPIEVSKRKEKGFLTARENIEFQSGS